MRMSCSSGCAPELTANANPLFLALLHHLARLGYGAVSVDEFVLDATETIATSVRRREDSSIFSIACVLDYSAHAYLSGHISIAQTAKRLSLLAEP